MQETEVVHRCGVENVLSLGRVSLEADECGLMRCLKKYLKPAASDAWSFKHPNKVFMSASGNEACIWKLVELKLHQF